MKNDKFDIRDFHNWALGNLVDNGSRGMFAEWLVGHALKAIDKDVVRREWNAFDLQYGEITVEVKTSGLSQTWSPDKRTIPRFDIAPRKQFWLERSNEWVRNDPPARFADVYVFCLHEPIPATNENVLDKVSWKFWVLSKQALDRELGPQKSVGLTTLNRLAKPIGWSAVKTEVDRCVTNTEGLTAQATTS